MAKKFAPRVSKRQRKTLDMSNKLSRDLFDTPTGSLFEGAELMELPLAKIKVKEQVRTKFNDSSLKELSENIKANGLIQPLVIHKTGRVYTLICGERRYRAMNLIKLEKAPCFILSNKTESELMAIQFSENSARENLHYVDKADGVLNYQKTTGASERKIVKALGISKSEVHRGLQIAKMSKDVKEAAKVFDIEKYVLVEWDTMVGGTPKQRILRKIVKGEIRKRAELKSEIAAGKIIKAGKKTTRKKVTKKTSTMKVKQQSADELLKTLKKNARSMKVDRNTKKLLNDLIKQTQA